jgi:hypothetical protein
MNLQISLKARNLLTPWLSAAEEGVCCMGLVNLVSAYCLSRFAQVSLQVFSLLCMPHLFWLSFLNKDRPRSFDQFYNLIKNYEMPENM